MPTRTSRRRFLQRSAAIGAGVWVASREAVAAESQRLSVGVIGVGRRGFQNLNELLDVRAARVAALCDVDEKFLDKASEMCPDAPRYSDFRVMLEKEKSLDAVLVATADHTHAPASLMALDLGKHVYCEKPLSHNVFEARRLAEAAKRNKRVTQLGTQIHAGENYRRVVEIVRSGAIGAVREVHCYVTKIWGAQKPKPAPPYPPVPDGYNYDAWLGPAEEWPYHTEWARGRWRQWWNFGNGTLGDMGCHYMDLPFWALDLRHPTSVGAEGVQTDQQGCPVWMIVRYEFPARGDAPPVKLMWYDGDKKPEALADWGLTAKEWPNGVIFVGDKGKLAANYNRYLLLPQKEFADFKPSVTRIPPSIGHHSEWVHACRAGDASGALCNFEYSGPLSEAVLLGTVAYRAGKTIEWNAEKTTIPNAPDAEQFVRRVYRKGWEIA